MQELSGDRLFLKADEFSYNKAYNILKALGRVHLLQYKKNTIKELSCDEITYDKKNDRVIARGHVYLKDENNNVSYSDYLELNDDFKNGFIESAHIITNKNERLLGDRGERKNNNFTHFYNASYTPCLVNGKDDASWQFNAKEVVHDAEEQVIRYYHVTFSFYGFPLFYLPYFSHVDPTVKRKTGLLMPGFEYNETNGPTVIPSVYYALDDYSDLTLSPVIMKNKNPIIHGFYRRHIFNGAIDINSSIQGNQFPKNNFFSEEARRIPLNHWHLFFKFNKDIDPYQRFQFFVNRASHGDYLTNYPVLVKDASDDSKDLISKFEYEYFKKNVYSTLKGFVFQLGNQKTTPVVLPSFLTQYFGKEDMFGGFPILTVSVDYLSRKYGKPGFFAKNSARLYTHLHWAKESRISNHFLSMYVDCYLRAYMVKNYQKNHVQNITHLKNHQVNNSLGKALFLPSLRFSWSYPLISRQTSFHYLIEPRTSVIFSPHVTNDFPNNDSLNFTLDETSLFLTNRFDGYDRFDSGSRFIYGLFQKVYLSSASYISLFTGHSLRLDHKQIAPNINLGEDRKRSDIVNHLKIVPFDYLKLRYRNAIDYRSKKERFREVGAAIGKPIFNIHLGYIDLKKHTFLDERLSQINWMASSQLNPNWSLSHGEIRDLSGHKKGVLNKFTSFKWGNDCMDVKFLIYSTNLTREDGSKNRGFAITFNLKLLGEYTVFSPAQEYEDTGLSHF